MRAWNSSVNAFCDLVAGVADALQDIAIDPASRLKKAEFVFLENKY
jgi:hypothetical protein